MTVQTWYTMGMAKRSKASRTTTDGRKRVAGYIRVSTLEQTESGLGLQAQEEQIRAWARLCGFEVGGMFCDAGESGAKAPSARFGLSEALAKVRSGELAGIVANLFTLVCRSTSLGGCLLGSRLICGSRHTFLCFLKGHGVAPVNGDCFLIEHLHS